MTGAIVLEHPLLHQHLTRLRDRATPPGAFRALLADAASLMAVEVTRDLPVAEVEVQTPLAPARGVRLAGPPPALVAVMRAGLVMAEGFLRVLPEAAVGHLGLYRDEETLRPVPYYEKLPPHLERRRTYVLDPMLATGGSAAEAVRRVLRAGARDVRLVCLLAAPEGLERVRREHPGVPVYAAAVDRHLDARGFIVPGLGDAGDRAFGTG